MMKCIKDYRYHGATYIHDKEYDIMPEVAKSHEKYFGMALWAKKSESEPKAEKAVKSEKKEGAVKKAAKKVAKKLKK